MSFVTVHEPTMSKISRTIVEVSTDQRNQNLDKPTCKLCREVKIANIFHIDKV